MKKVIYASGNIKKLTDLARLIEKEYNTLIYTLNDSVGLAFKDQIEQDRFNNAKDYLWKKYVEDSKRTESMSNNFQDYLSNAANSQVTSIKKLAEWLLENKQNVNNRYMQNLGLLKGELHKYNLTYDILLEDSKRLIGDKRQRQDPDPQVSTTKYNLGEIIETENPMIIGIFGFRNFAHLEKLAEKENYILVLGGNPPQNEPDLKEKLDLLVDRSKLVLRVEDSNSKYSPKRPIGPRTELLAGSYSIDDDLGGEKIDVAHSIEINYDGTFNIDVLASQKDKENNLTRLVKLEDYIKEKESEMHIPFVLEEDTAEQLPDEVENVTKKEQLSIKKKSKLKKPRIEFPWGYRNHIDSLIDHYLRL